MHFISSVFCYKYNFLAIFFLKKGDFFLLRKKSRVLRRWLLRLLDDQESRGKEVGLPFCMKVPPE